MLNRILGHFSHDIGIDLGTANTLVGLKDQGIVINEPSVVALNKKTQEVLAVGDYAKKMVGKTPSNIVAVRPLKDGVISDLESCEKMLDYFVKKIHETPSGIPKVPRPRAVIGVPSGITEVEQRAVLRASKSAGVRETYLIEEPMAAAIGAGLTVDSPEGNMIVDIGGGTTEIAVISLGGIVVNRSLRVGGDRMDQDIIDYIKRKYNVLIGERLAEEAKKEIANVYKKVILQKVGSKSDNLDVPEKDLTDGKYFEVRGRNLKNGLPETVELTEYDMYKALEETVNTIVDSIKLALEDTPPELVSDIYSNKVFIAGGGAKLVGLNDLIADETGIPVKVVDNPDRAVVKGTLSLLDDIELLKLVHL